MCKKLIIDRYCQFTNIKYVNFVSYLKVSSIFKEALKMLCMVPIFSKLKVFVGNIPLIRYDLKNIGKQTTYNYLGK